MGTNAKLLVKIFLATSGLVFFGLPSLNAQAAQTTGYCGLPLCSSSPEATAIKQSLDIGGASLGWWDCRIQGKCQDLSKAIQKMPLDIESCSMDTLISYRKGIAEINDKLQSLLTQFGSKAKEALGTEMKAGLTMDLMEHFKKCYASGLFITDPDKCITEECEKFVSGLSKLKVNFEDCTSRLNALCPSECKSWDFSFEEPLVFGKINAYREKCINANFLPTMTAFDLPIFKKDIPLAERCLATGGQLEYEINNLKIEARDCTTDLYNNFNDKVVAFDKALAELGNASPAQNVGDEWHQRLAALLDKRINDHFIKCEEVGLFPTDKTQCLSTQCKQLDAEIQAFKINKEDCSNKRASLVIKTQFNFENKLIQNKLENFKERCIDGDMLPFGEIGNTWVTKSEYETRYSAVENKIATMGLEGEKTWPDTDLEIIPYTKLAAAVKGFKVNKEQCNFDKHIAPLRGNIDKYILLWRDAGFKIPASLDELSNLLTQYLFNCVDKKFTKSKAP